MDSFIVLITDRPGRSAALADHLARIADVQVVGTEERWSRGPGIAAVVSDLTLGRPPAVRCLQAFQSRYGQFQVPLVCLLRSPDPNTIAEARAFGAAAWLPADAPHAAVAEAVVQSANLADAAGKRLVHRSCRRAAEVLETLFQAAQDGTAPSMARVEAGLTPVIEALEDGGLERWLETVWAYDDATYQHCLLVTGYAASFAQFLGFARRDQQALVRAALVHDVGKAQIPLAILNKPGRLDADEMSVMRTHAAIGFDVLRRGGECDATTLDAVRHHHEMLDGSGYPDGLSGASISDTVRLLTICDIYAALTERRPYKAPLAADDALRILNGMSGKLEPALLEAFGLSVQHQTRQAA
ncbi:MAG TPA: HD domain-containing phosphohydrolase [Beijerinckiaceae bacterium]|jgi:putative nucleotidyltransferase with HDIG domain